MVTHCRACEAAGRKVHTRVTTTRIDRKTGNVIRGRKCPTCSTTYTTVEQVTVMRPPAVRIAASATS